MAGTSNEIDANFFRLIHQLVSTSCREGDRERRQTLRKPFDSFQHVAPWDGRSFPEDSAFFPVRCHDLTQGGFSFFMPTEPGFQTLVAAFGTPPQTTYVGAEVIRTDRVLVHASGRMDWPDDRSGDDDPEAPPADAGTPLFLVGCRFTRRLRKPALWQ